MPELPEVEMYRRFLAKHGLGRRLESLSIGDRRPLRGTPASAFRPLVGRRFVATRRHGKYLFAEASGAGWLLFHFGMTGDLQRFDEDSEPRGSALVASLKFTDGNGIAFLDPRKFGRFGLVDDPDAFVRRRGLGADALDLSRPRFESLLRRRRGTVKALLLNQRVIAGVGNLYADEILFQAGLHPQASVASLDARRMAGLFTAMKRVLRTAIDRGGDTRRLPRSYLLRHRDDDGRCPRCRAVLTKVRVAGRTSSYCPRHQRKPRNRPTLS
ncbi:MAG: Fpg/Nei family DNA glycosylase [Candidatus Polarisedimenticolia bacterium]